MRWRWFVTYIIAQRRLHVAEFFAHAGELAPEIVQQTILRGDRGVERLHGLIQECDAHFQLGEALFESAAHRANYEPMLRRVLRPRPMP